MDPAKGTTVQHSPEPWAAVDLEDGEFDIVREGPGPMDSRTVATVRRGDPKVTRANALLIKEAPNLLTALRDLVGLDGASLEWDYTQRSKFLEVARGTIARATGDDLYVN